MNFDPHDLIDSNYQLLKEAASSAARDNSVLMTIATWGRGADPEFLQALQPYRHGLGFNGSIVAVVPEEIACQWLPEEVQARLSALRVEPNVPVYSAVFKAWVIDSLPV